MSKDTIKQDIIDNIEEDNDIDELLTELFRKKRAKQVTAGWWWSN